MTNAMQPNQADGRELLGRALGLHIFHCADCSDEGPCMEAQGLREILHLFPVLLAERTELTARLGAIEILASGHGAVERVGLHPRSEEATCEPS